MKWKIKHKEEGWTGELEIMMESQRWTSSHRVGLEVHFEISQDPIKPDGTHVEDPNVGSLEELEIIEAISNNSPDNYCDDCGGYEGY